MARRKNKIGICHLCGTHTKLSYEHIPPRAAFNDQPVVRAGIDELIKKESSLDKLAGKTYQRGIGGYTLCEKCNSLMGAWYGPAFIDWTYQLARVLILARGEPSLYYLYKIFPLRVIKQIVCMFFSLNGEQFRNAQPNLARFVLNKDMKYLDPHIRIYCFYNRTHRLRHSGGSGLLNVINGSFYIISEIALFPMGYVMDLNNHKPDMRLFHITFFSEYGYNDWKEIGLRLPLLPIYTYFPGDYCSKEEVLGEMKNSG
jgi:hypothetical protein